MHTPLHFYKKLIKSIICNPNAYENDLYITKNLSAIKAAIGILKNLIPLSDERLFRGVLLDHNKSEVALRPQLNRRYNSYSLSREVALEFADPSHPLSFPLVLLGKKFGYLTESNLIDEDVLYHHSWGVFLGLFEGPLADFQYQKEVVLFDSGKIKNYKKVEKKY